MSTHTVGYPAGGGLRFCMECTAAAYREDEHADWVRWPCMYATKRYSHEAKGLVLRDASGIIYMPFTYHGSGWDCAPLYDPHGVYVRNGYNIFVSDEDIVSSDELVISTLTAEEVLARPGPTEDVLVSTPRPGPVKQE